MDQPPSMCALEAAPGLEEHLEHVAPAPWLAAQPLTQGRPLDELHGHVDRVLVFSDVVDTHDVGMGELGQRLRLREQGTAPSGTRTAVQQLERDLAVQLGVVRQVDRPHRTRTERAQHDVPSELRDWAVRLLRRATLFELLVRVECPARVQRLGRRSARGVRMSLLRQVPVG